MAILTLTTGLDVLIGTSGADTVETPPNNSNLAAGDRVTLGSGTDTVAFLRTSDLSVAASRMAGFSGADVLDVTAATSVLFGIDDALMDQSDNDRLTILFGSDPLQLDLRDLAPSTGTLVLSGTGSVTLYDAREQAVEMAAGVGGRIAGGDFNDTLKGAGATDRLNGGAGEDHLIGAGGADILRGGDGDDLLEGGSGNDDLGGGAGRDTLETGSGNDTLSGGTGTDQFIVLESAGRTTITDYETRNFAERIDLTDLTGLSGMADLTLRAEGAHTRVTGTGLDLTVQNVAPSALGGGDFIFETSNPLVISIGAGASTAQLQQAIDDAPVGATIRLGAGAFDITETLLINRSDISIIGAGEGRTILRTKIPDSEASQTILVQPEDFQERLGTITRDAAQGSNQVTLAPGHGLEVGDLLFIAQENDAAWIAETGNTGWDDPSGDGLNPELFYLRELRSEITAINGNTVTLRNPLPYAFDAGIAQVAETTALENITLSNFTIQGMFGTPDPFLFETTMEEWASIAALELDNVRDSNLNNITIIDAASHAFRFQRTYDVTGDKLTGEGAHNKSGSNGYHFLLHEAFETHLTDLHSTDARHALLFSSYNAEHYNSAHILFANRDVNFHGSPDADNTIVVDQMRLDYPVGTFPQWAAVQPGFFPLHPYTDLFANDVTFRDLISGERRDTVVAHDDGAILSTGIDNDSLIGGAGNDTLDGGENGDILFGGGGRDTFIREYEDFTDTILDFETGAGGDILLLRGTAYERFEDVVLEQQGAHTVLNFGPLGQTIFENTRADAFTSHNFQFQRDQAPGQDLDLKADDLTVVGTGRNDSVAITSIHLDDANFMLDVGRGFDTVVVRANAVNGNLGEMGDFSGVEEFDLTNVRFMNLTIDDALARQSDNNRVILSLGDDTTRPMVLDVEQMGRGRTVWIDGKREVRLHTDSENVVRSTDRVGTDILGGDLRDVIFGGRNTDQLDGGAGNDVIFGVAGDDTLDGGAGADTINGGPGSDLIYVDHAGDRVAESRRWDGEDTVISSVDFRMGRSHIENLELAGNAKIGAGNGLRNEIIGTDRANILDGGGNVDTLKGGGGNDIYLIRSPGDSAVEAAGDGIDGVRAFRSYKLEANIENLFIQTVRTKAGDPVQNINGIGNNLDNLMIGNPFDNTLSGREGNDTLRGQDGADTFLFDTTPGSGNVDQIVDFTPGEDRIAIDDALVAGLGRGGLSARNFQDGPRADEGNDRILYDQATGRLSIDNNGSAAGGEVLLAILQNRADLSAEDIVLI